MSWVADASIGGGSVGFRGSEGTLNATVWKGSVNSESWSAFRSLSVPVLRNRLLPGWRVEAPDKYLHFKNDGDDRRFLLFYAPRSGNPLVLKFDRPVPESLLGNLKDAFQKEQRNGEQERGLVPQADREVQSLPDREGQPEPGNDSGDRNASEREGREPQGQQVAAPAADGSALPWWKTVGKKRKKGR